jgi:tRNA A-37 threonylcarbamoyl transferase component Bud32
LARLKVSDDWHVPVERSLSEIAWLRQADLIAPGTVPRVLGEDPIHGVALIEYLPPEQFRLWKDELLTGHIDLRIATAIANVIGRIHSTTLMDASVAAAFANDALFDALRLDPYLRTIAARYPALARPILECVKATTENKIALVHGDLSPKNILVSRADNHPVFIDAECAWFGDPAFDAAFLINHLLLKAVHLPAIARDLCEASALFVATWLENFPAGLRPALEARTAALLPCLMLARVDGKSPAEYLSVLNQEKVRDIAMPLIARPKPRVTEVIEAVRGSDP